MLVTNDEWVRRVRAFITTEGEGGDPGDGGDAGVDAGTDGATDPGADPGTTGDDDLSTLFSPEDIEAKRTALAEAKAEEDRRAALTDDERKAEDDAAAETAALNEIPEAYEFQLPEGFQADEGLMEEVSAFAKENKLTKGAADQISGLAAKLLIKQQEGRENQFQEIKAGWLESAKNDKEIGADVAKGKESVAARAFNTIATPEMKELVDQYGIGDHPEMLRMFYRLSSLMGDDKMHNSGTGAGLGGAGGVAETVNSIFNHPSRKA